MSVVWTLEETYEHLLDSEDGTITCITSRTVREVADGLLLSNAVRRGVIGLVKTVSREFAPEIRANAVLPGTIETPRIEELIDAGVERGTYDDYEEGLTAMADDIPMDRIGEPGNSVTSSPSSRVRTRVSLPGPRFRSTAGCCGADPIAAVTVTADGSCDRSRRLSRC